MRNIFLFTLIVTLVIFSACQLSETRQNDGPTHKSVEEPLIKANKQAVKAEEQQIIDFLNRYNWKMKETGSGLRYAIYHHGKGEKAKPGMIAVLKYNVKLIDGDEIYNSDNDGLKQFLIGKGGVESGLEEGILLLRVGDQAKFIIPSHLAFGLLGDQNLVPPKSTLIYDVELIALN
ncbi:MAG: FKBP-type peptidyl-prolyl cis-trans isomerase [Lentimicrobiaceae bacterium]|nr:FKBP-type peptidyl-prolyl cis-trans isomerase [Lentimicrobiaceae bacterium]